MIYFGCIGQPGHFVWVDEQRRAGRDHPWREWFEKQDGKLAPRAAGRMRDYVPTIHYLFDETVTVVAYWDRSVDSRPGSNSMFLAEGRFSLEEMFAMAQREFPMVYGRAVWVMA